MRGGKRENAGRKGYGKTKTYRLPIALEDKINALVEAHKHDKENPEKPAFDSVTKSKARIVPMYPEFTKEQIRRFRIWLDLHKFAKNLTEARKMTETPRLTKETFLRCYKLAGERHNWIVDDIANAYKIKKT